MFALQEPAVQTRHVCCLATCQSPGHHRNSEFSKKGFIRKSLKPLHLYGEGGRARTRLRWQNALFCKQLASLKRSVIWGTVRKKKRALTAQFLFFRASVFRAEPQLTKRLDEASKLHQQPPTVQELHDTCPLCSSLFPRVLSQYNPRTFRSIKTVRKASFEIATIGFCCKVFNLDSILTLEF